MAKLKDGRNWYLMDLENYTPEFLCDIIRELNTEIEELKRGV